MRKRLSFCYWMLFVTVVLVGGTFVYLSYSSTTEQALRSDRLLKTLNGPWKFMTGDSMQYAEPGFDDSRWEDMSLAAPPGVHDDDVGLSGFIPGWTSKGHPKYSGYAWYRLKISFDSLPANKLAFDAPPAVDDAYQLFLNGSLVASSADFSDSRPIVYSIRPQMIELPDKIKGQKELTIAFRVWMGSASLGVDAGGIHIAPAIGDRDHIGKKYRFQWEQTIKGYIVEVVWPLIFLLLAITMLVLKTPSQSCKWFVTALILLGLMRLNQAVYFWFHIENSREAVIVGSAILRPLVLGSWLMAWWEWFDLRQPNWLPGVIGVITGLFVTLQLLSIFRVSQSIRTYFPQIANCIRLLLLAMMLCIIFQGVRKRGVGDLLTLLAALLMVIALFPQEISALHIIPGIWFPFGVGVSRGQFFYVAFVFVMYGVLIQKVRREGEPG